MTYSSPKPICQCVEKVQFHVEPDSKGSRLEGTGRYWRLRGYPRVICRRILSLKLPGVSIITSFPHQKVEPGPRFILRNRFVLPIMIHDCSPNCQVCINQYTYNLYNCITDTLWKFSDQMPISNSRAYVLCALFEKSKQGNPLLSTMLNPISTENKPCGCATSNPGELPPITK